VGLLALHVGLLALHVGVLALHMGVLALHLGVLAAPVTFWHYARHLTCTFLARIPIA
jgi:hypothetical protein